MPEKTFRAYNAATGSLGATARPAGQPTSSTSGLTRTLLQIAFPSTGPAGRILGWGYSFVGGAPTNAPWMDLIDSGTVAASSLTAHVPAGIQKMNCPAGEASVVAGNLGTALTGYCTTAAGTASTEGTLTANTTRLLDGHDENGPYFYWRFELGREPEIAPGNFARIRATPSAATSLSALVWLDWAE